MMNFTVDQNQNFYVINDARRLGVEFTFDGTQVDKESRRGHVHQYTHGKNLFHVIIPISAQAE